MANVRCPMCSKLNTPDAEVCSYCGARLKPVMPSSGTPGPRPGGADDDAPDWLRSLRSDDPGAEQEESSEPEAEAGDVPDWLSRIRDRSGEEQPAEAAEEAGDDAPDWLRGLQGDAQPASGESSAGDEDLSSSDWFGRLQDASQAETPAAGQPADFNAQDDAEKTSDWLRGLSDETFSESSTGAPVESASEVGQVGGEEDWVNMLSTWSPGQEETPREEAPPAAGQGEEDFSWLAGLEQETASRGPEETVEDGENFGLTGFLSEIEQSTSEETSAPEELGSFTGWEQEAAPSSEGLPDWFSSQPPTGVPSEEGAPAPAGADEGGLPEWLQSMGGEPSPPPAGQQPPASEEGLPGWLSGAEPVELPRAEEPAEGDLPSWLGEGEPLAAAASEDSDDSGLPSWLSASESAPPAGQPEAETTQDDSGIPAWMRAGEESQAAPQPEAEPSAEGLPDWFSGFEQPAAPVDAGQEAQPEEAAFASDLPFAELPLGAQIYPGAAELEPAALPEADVLGADFSFAQDEPPVEAVSSEPAGEGVPDWLRDFEAETPIGESVSPLIEAEPALPSPALEGDQPFAVDLPDWLAEDEVTAGEAAEQPVEMSGETLAQADLPEWVKEMRPIESIIPGETQSAEVERRAEKSGPLAGLPGILPSEELAARYRRPPVYSVKLRASEKQRAQAAQFETLLTQEMQPLLLPTKGRRVQGLLVRVLIALLLIVALALPPLMEMEPLAIPALGPDETGRMYEEINTNLAPNGAVLLAVDFEPALAGEMRLASQPVIEHLLEKNARIVVVSTRSSGPALAELLMEQTAVNYPQFDREQNFINLGFLPGDMISLLAFARQPAFAAPGTLGGEMAWDSPVLQEILDIRDFSSVIVLTDAAETGRIWVEQVKPLMGDVPLLMVTSAQAAPMMAPFVQSGQVTGMVSGMVGGFLYSQWAQQVDTPAAGYLASYQVGLLLAFALTLVGGLFSGGLALMKRTEKDEE